jgi:hypothetical protein
LEVLPRYIFALAALLVTWAACGAGVSAGIRFVVVDPAAAGVQYALTTDGDLWRSSGTDGRWDVVWAGGGRALAVRPGGAEGAAAHWGCACGGPAAGDTTSILDLVSGATLYRSYDQGSSWSPVRVTGSDPAAWATLTADSINQSILYAHLNDHSLVRSLDGGRTWRAWSP